MMWYEESNDSLSYGEFGHTMYMTVCVQLEGYNNLRFIFSLLYSRWQWSNIPKAVWPEQMIHHLEDLDRAVEIIESARQSGGRALSHCWYGRNRSATLLVAYYEGMTAIDANELIKQTRHPAAPYLDVLEAYSKHYLSKGNSDGQEESSKRRT